MGVGVRKCSTVIQDLHSNQETGNDIRYNQRRLSRRAFTTFAMNDISQLKTKLADLGLSEWQSPNSDPEVHLELDNNEMTLMEAEFIGNSKDDLEEIPSDPREKTIDTIASDTSNAIAVVSDGDESISVTRDGKDFLEEGTKGIEETEECKDGETVDVDAIISVTDNSILQSNHSTFCDESDNSFILVRPLPRKDTQIIHKPLKDLIYKTNKEIYNVDSHKVQYKAGLSKKNTLIPSLHPNRQLK